MEPHLAGTERRLLSELTRLDLDTETLVETLVEALDRLDLLDRHLDAGARETSEVRAITAQLSSALAAHGAVELIGARGERAAPDTHHVVDVTDAAGLEADTVVKVVKRGVRYRGTQLRPAAVVVSSGKGAQA
ncbi:hypothetical protein GCM10022254_32460 [Actinomadura meridiana]|uniref:Nucleotide exchange factor GrpE n=1 Tax=Actinomadura meridiana TaxID=559626 RepID=A0ABP8C2Q8_9ACTN